MDYEYQLDEKTMVRFDTSSEGLLVTVYQTVNSSSNDREIVKDYGFTWQEVYKAINEYLVGLS